MKFNKIIPYKLKKMLPILGLAGAGVVSSCEKQFIYDPAPENVDLCFDWNLNNSELLFDTSSPREFLPSDLVKYYAGHPDVKNIYLVPTGDWRLYMGPDFIEFARPGLEMLLNYSPKIHGKGDFNFTPNSISPADSLWLVQNGWTVNQNQR